MKTQQTVPQIFAHKEFGKIRGVIIESDPWFVGIDVADVLGYKDTFAALKQHVDDDDKQNWQNTSFASPRGLTVINESGLYSLIIRSNMPKAKEFTRWVTKEVMPSLRKYGYYAMPGRSEYFELNNVTSAKFLVVIEDVKSLNQVCYDLKAKQKRMSEISEELLELDSDCKVLEVKKQELIEKLDESMQEFFGLGRKLNAQDKDLIEDIKSKEELS